MGNPGVGFGEEGARLLGTSTGLPQIPRLQQSGDYKYTFDNIKEN